MAAFLFFLSVALVVTNREDIQYTLFADHKMRSRAAAESMLDLALMTMRTQPAWESELKNFRPTFRSGASGWAEVVPFRNDGSNAQLPFPAPRSGETFSRALELIAKGSSGPFVSERRLVLEEFRLADSLLDGAKRPHLFAVSGTNLRVLTPSMRWDTVEAPGGQTLERSWAADGGSLHGLIEGTGSKPPVIKDFSKQVLPGQIVIPGQFQESQQQIPQGHGAVVLDLKGSKWTWTSLPDPGDQLGKVTQPSISNDSPLTGDGSTVSWDSLTLDWDTVAKSPSQLTVPYEYFNGPRVEWFGITGQVAAMGNQRYVCHGTHYLYAGLRLKNTQQSNGDVRSQGTDPTLYKEPCVLVYDSQAKTWSVALDYLKVSSDPLVEPTVVPPPHPDPNTLLVTGPGKIYVRVLGETSNAWYQVSQDHLSPSSLPTKPQLFALNEDIYYTEPITEPLTSGIVHKLNRHDVGAFYPENLPIVNPNARYDPRSNFAGELEPPVHLIWSTRLNTLTGKNTDLFALLTLTTFVEAYNGHAPQVKVNQVLGHYDGRQWQLLPSGLPMFLPDNSSFRREWSLFSEGGPGPAVGSSRLILTSYNTNLPLLRRYVPVTRRNY